MTRTLKTIQADGFSGGLVWTANGAGIGTGYGTTVAFTTLFFPAGILLDANPVLIFGAILSGAVFGDNLAPISDTTIVSAVTQDADIGCLVASPLGHAIVAAVPAFASYVVMGGVFGGREPSTVGV